MPFTGEPICLSDQQRTDLQEISQSRSLPAGFVFRAKVILMLAEGFSFSAIKERLQTTAPTIARWKERFLESGLEGLDTYHPGQKAVVLTAVLRAKILAATRKKPRDGSTHWSCRKLAAVVGVSKDMVHRVWREAGLKPHRLERYLASDDPDFERKAADVIGLYLNPPQHAAVLCVDGKSAIQAFKRWIDWTRCFRSRPAALSATGMSITGTGRFHSTLRWTPRPAECTARRQRVTPA